MNLKNSMKLQDYYLSELSHSMEKMAILIDVLNRLDKESPVKGIISQVFNDLCLNWARYFSLVVENDRESREAEGEKTPADKPIEAEEPPRGCEVSAITTEEVISKIAHGYEKEAGELSCACGKRLKDHSAWGTIVNLIKLI